MLHNFVDADSSPLVDKRYSLLLFHLFFYFLGYQALRIEEEKGENREQFFFLKR